MTKIALGADHGGFELKQRLKRELERRGIAVDDQGCFDTASVDYPDYAAEVAGRVATGAADQGILVCTTGLGMSMAANKCPGIRAALCTDARMARLAREHNDANVLVLGGGVTTPADADRILDAWLSAGFSDAERHRRRVDKMGRICSGAGTYPAVRADDPDLYAAMQQETRRQHENINLIASENYVSRAVLEASGCNMTNKYAEGYPGKRWYQGCQFVDEAERLAIDRVKRVFGADHANVQPHCGSSANMAVYFAALKPGDRILAMNLAHGGHLTHGHPANFSGRIFQISSYGVSRETERIDYDEVAEIARKSQPKLIVAGASSYPRTLDFPRLRAIADSVGALLMVDIAHIAGLVAAGCHPSPVPYSEFVTGTTHKTLRGPRGGFAMCRKDFAEALDHEVFPGLQGGPLMHTIAAKAVCFREALEPAFGEYQRQVVRNAQAIARRLAEQGLRIVSGGTDNHLLLVDLTSLGITGKDAGLALEKANIIVNKNAIPFDPKSTFLTSGIRIGAPAATTRGMKEPEMKTIADLIVRVLRSPRDEPVAQAARKAVLDLADAFPVP